MKRTINACALTSNETLDLLVGLQADKGACYAGF